MKFSKLIATSLLLGGICTFNSVNAVDTTTNNVPTKTDVSTNTDVSLNDVSQVYYDDNCAKNIEDLVRKYYKDTKKIPNEYNEYYIIKLEDGSNVITKSEITNKIINKIKITKITKLTKRPYLRRKISIGTPKIFQAFINALTNNAPDQKNEVDLSPDSFDDNNTQLDTHKTQLSTDCARRLEF